MKLPLRRVGWVLLAGAVLTAVFMAYRNPHFIVAVTGLVMSCF